MILYHYTSAMALPSIKRQGLLNMFGLMFFTISENTEPTVDFHQARQQGRVSLEIDDSFEKVSDLLQTDYNEMACYFSPSMIHLTGANIDEWYCSRVSKIQPEKLTYEVLENGEWINYDS